MSYKSFKNISDVCENFNLDYKELNFIKEKKFNPHEYFINQLLKSFSQKRTFCSEGSICEKIISPIINTLGDENSLPVWSHIKLNVKKELNLTGEVDYLLAPEVVGGYKFKKPVVCLGEAKKDDFIGGWGQVGAEMIAAQMLNDNKEVTIYGLVSNGYFWEFAQLNKNLLTINKDAYNAPRELDKIFNILNWMFCKARKNADQLLMLDS